MYTLQLCFNLYFLVPRRYLVIKIHLSFGVISIHPAILYMSMYNTKRNILACCYEQVRFHLPNINKLPFAMHMFKRRKRVI